MSSSGFGWKLLKRSLCSRHSLVSQSNQCFNSTSSDNRPVCIESEQQSISSLPPLLSDQAKSFIDKRKAFEESSSNVCSKVKDSFPHAVKSEFNQCFNITCQNNSSVFIHALSGFTFCPKCKLVQLRKSFSQECFSQEDRSKVVDNLYDDSEQFYTSMFPDQTVGKFRKSDPNSWKVKKTLQLHKASKLFLDTLEALECFVNYESSSVYFTYRDANGHITGFDDISLENSGNLKLKVKSTPAKSEDAANSQVMLTEFVSNESDYLIITAGSLNACAIYQTSSVSTLCLKTCHNFKFPLEFVPLLAQYHRIVFFLPEMATNYQVVHQVSKLLGQDRCYYISSQLGCKYKSPLDALKSLNSAQDFTDLLNQYSIPVNSLSSNFTDLLNDAKDFLSDPKSSLGYPFHRFEMLNSLLGGLRLGEITVVSGDTGQGKTTFATELALDVCLHNNLPTAFVSLEMQPKITLLKMGRQLILQEVSLKNFDFFQDAITNVPMFISNCSGYVILKDILLEFEKMCMQFGVRHIVIDHLQYLQGIEMLDNKVISSAEELVSVNRVLRKLKQFVSSYNIHMTILAQPRKQYGGQGTSFNGGSRILSNHEIAGTVALTQIPDNILILQSQKQYSKENNSHSPGTGSVGGKSATPRMSKYIEVTKNRFRGSLGTMPLVYCEKSGTFSVAAAVAASSSQS